MKLLKYVTTFCLGCTIRFPKLHDYECSLTLFQKGCVTMAEYNQKYFKILVVDDDSSFLNLVERILSTEKTDYMLFPEMGELKGKYYRNNS